jgi:arylsulfatase A-like enzyme
VAPPEAPAAGIASELGARRSKGSGLDLRGRSVLLVTVDALRADHLGLYGGLRGVSPGLDALGRQGVVFDAAYAATPHTSYSLTSVMTGKYMRPLLLQGAGADSDTWAGLLRTYGYRTAAFYPPAVFFIDGDHFTRFRDNHFDFEYAKVEFAEGQKRIQQVKDYLESTRNLERKPLFLWVHLFGPHEPYETQDTDYGPRDIDRYDSEIRAADRTALGVVEAFRARAPDGIVIVSADHGEEFGDHGGRYHGTSVYDEQVRVPLLVVGPGLAQGRRVEAPVQTIDLLPTVLGGLGAPVPPRIRGRDLSDFLAPSAAPDKSDLGRAVAETDDYTLYAEGSSRLVCSRRTGACQLFDISTDPAEKRDVGPERSAAFAELTQKARQLSASHGAYETEGLRAEGKGWPAAILRGLSGDADVAPELGALLDDADVNVRRKAAELLFGLSGGGQQAALRLAATREEDAETRRYIALALTRSGQGAPLVKELLGGPSLEFRRMAALALAESGDDAGREELVGWWRAEPPLEFRQALEVLAALTKIGGKGTSLALASRLGDVRLRPYIARALAQLADDDVRPALARAFASERYVPTRLPLGRALWAVGGKAELVAPLVRFLGTPEPLDGGLGLAVDAGVLDQLAKARRQRGARRGHGPWPCP